ncbi:hypothetical protein KUTeg_000682 [Tegillarca granosa]|uniref:Uncharacterized protein n=1 Tax=Tegillarca granosa TaxID=220873 RepID=A0ABQ9G1D2_TEGGR|nr:hypothetical protein KUTeg_000682 [Tegillarca granosa]
MRPYCVILRFLCPRKIYFITSLNKITNSERILSVFHLKTVKNSNTIVKQFEMDFIMLNVTIFYMDENRNSDFILLSQIFNKVFNYSVYCFFLQLKQNIL